MASHDENDQRGPWNASLEQFREWDPTWAKATLTMVAEPWRSGVLPTKFVELASVGINAACTNLNAEGTRRHIRNAIAAGASRDELLTVLMMASVMALHSCSLGAPILVEEAKAKGVDSPPAAPVPTPACDRLRAAGQWNTAWDPFLALDPGWTDAFIAVGVPVYTRKVFSPKEIELLSIAFDASYTHMYAPGTRRHIKGALAAGATIAEIMAILKLCVAHGIEACNLGIPILVEELERAGKGDAATH